MNVGRPRAFDEERALDAAMDVFWQEGYNDTSLQSLLKATGLSKSSLYQTFGSKQDLFIRCLEQYKQNMLDELLDALAVTGSPRQFIHNFLVDITKEATPDNHHRKGCLFVKTAHELAQKEPVIASAMTEGISQVATVFRRAIDQAKAMGEIKTSTPTDSLLAYLMTSITGLRTMVMTGADRVNLEPVIELTMTVIE